MPRRTHHKLVGLSFNVERATAEIEELGGVKEIELVVLFLFDQADQTTYEIPIPQDAWDQIVAKAQGGVLPVKVADVAKITAAKRG